MSLSKVFTKYINSLFNDPIAKLFATLITKLAVAGSIPATGKTLYD